MFDSFPAGGNVLVQGAARGLGLGFVRHCLAEPKVARIVATCRHPDDAAALAKFAASDPQRLFIVPLDLADHASIERAATEVAKVMPKLHRIVVCGGVLHDATLGLAPEKRLADVRPDALARAFAINATGPLLVARSFERLLAHAERAEFATLSARVGSIEDNRLGGWYAYRASKAAQNQLFRTLSIEWARSRRNVIVTSLHPGTTDTDLSKPFQSNVPPGKLFDVMRASRQLLTVIDRLQPSDSGRFYVWDGSQIPGD